MKKYAILAILSMLFVAYMVFQVFTSSQNTKVSKTLQSLKQETTCSTKPSRGLILTEAKLLDIKKLADYETYCQSFATDTLYLNVTLPTDTSSANQLAAKLASSLEEMSNYELKSVVSITPPASWNSSASAEFAAGKYTPVLTTFYKQLVSLGITAEKLGTVFFIPNPNLPNFSKAYLDPVVYSKMYNLNAQILKTELPAAKVGVLLSTSTYPTVGFSWDQGEYLSLMPYIKDILPVNLNALAFSGFPWLPAGGTLGSSVIDPHEYLRPRVVEEVLQATSGITDVYYLTGTFSAGYPVDPKRTVFLPPKERRQILTQTISTLASKTQENQQTHIILDTQDKTDAAQDSFDWGYFNSSFSQNPAHAQVLVEFLVNARKAGLPVILKLGN